MKPDKTIHEVTFEYNFSHIVKPQAVNEIEAGQLISIFQFKWFIAEQGTEQVCHLVTLRKST